MADNSKDKMSDLVLAEAVRQACVKEAKEGFRDASIQGLCSDGAMEAAVSAIQRLDIEELIQKLK
ncbi:MAG: acetyltransferase [Balneolaceae bacterium]